MSGEASFGSEEIRHRGGKKKSAKKKVSKGGLGLPCYSHTITGGASVKLPKAQPSLHMAYATAVGSNRVQRRPILHRTKANREGNRGRYEQQQKQRRRTAI